MAIRFACPSCQQPIEIDEQWAGQSVACPYCKRVVTAPPTSTWPPGDIPVATPAQSAFGMPPPPPGGAFPATPRRGGAAAGWALTLALFAIFLMIVAGFGIFKPMLSAMMKELGPNPTQAEIQRTSNELAEKLRKGEVTFEVSPITAVASVAGALCGLAALMLAIQSLIRKERRKGMAVTALVISVPISCCQVLMLLAAFQLTAAFNQTTQPSHSNQRENTLR